MSHRIISQSRLPNNIEFFFRNYWLMLRISLDLFGNDICQIRPNLAALQVPQSSLLAQVLKQSILSLSRPQFQVGISNV